MFAADHVKKTRNVTGWAWTIAAMLLIFVHSALPGPLSSVESGKIVQVIMAVLRLFHIRVSDGSLSFFIRKCGHFTEYTLLGLALMNQRWGRPRRQLPYVTAAGALYAVTDEIHQYFVPGRSCEFRDVCIDAAGAAAGALLYAFLKKRHIGPRRILTALSVPALFFLLCAYEAQAGTGIKCVFYQLTGLYCPGCGSGRAIHALFQGQFSEAFGYNILFILLGFPCLLILLHEYLRLVFPSLRLKPVSIPQPLLAGVTGVIVLYWILRNIPAFSFLAP